MGNQMADAEFGARPRAAGYTVANHRLAFFPALSQPSVDPQSRTYRPLKVPPARSQFV